MNDLNVPTVRLPVWVLLTVAGVGFLGGIVGASFVRERSPSGAEQPKAAVQRQGSPSSRESTARLDPVADVVDRASPAVVSVVVTKDLPRIEEVPLDLFRDPFFGSSPFRFRLRRPSGQVEKREVGGGTGFVVDANGLILTNRHVVSDTEADYTVIFNSGEKVSAKVLARDPVLDLAVFRVDRRGLPTIPLGDSASLRVGQTVVAIGNALGEFRNTVSVGVISGLGRQVTAGDALRGDTEILDQVIQTDAAINPGNSGGPLLNVDGEVIGVNTAIASGAENIGFAIPISEVARVVADVREHGSIRRPFIGVRYVLVTPALADVHKLSVEYGALVLSGDRGEGAVVPGSPADRAGIRENDILLEVDGKKIDAQHSLSFLIRQKRIGERIQLKLLSRGEEKSVDLTLTAAP